MRRPLSPVCLEPAIKQHANWAFLFIQPRRRADLIIPVDKSSGFDAQSRQQAKTGNDLNMVAQILRRNFQRGKALRRLAIERYCGGTLALLFFGLSARKKI